MNKQTILSYKNFNALSKDVIELAKKIMPDKVIYLNFLNDKVQVTMRVSKNNTEVKVKEGDIIPVDEAICNQIDYKNDKPLIFSNTKENKFDTKVNKTIINSNIKSYLGIPINYQNGKRFGALCAAHHDQIGFDEKDIELLKSVAKLFSYYLELEYLAYQDPLTGLNNSQYLITLHDDILKSGGLVMMLDLDSFKDVNDNFGHHIGDEVLKEVGEKLTKCQGQFKTACAFRIGGDEFLLYIKDELKPKEIEETLTSLVKKMETWETPIGNIKLSTSIGAIKIDPYSHDEFSQLLKKADKLLYQAKNKGKNTYVFEKYTNA